MLLIGKGYIIFIFKLYTLIVYAAHAFVLVIDPVALFALVLAVSVVVELVVIAICFFVGPPAALEPIFNWPTVAIIISMVILKMKMEISAKVFAIAEIIAFIQINL